MCRVGLVALNTKIVVVWVFAALSKQSPTPIEFQPKLYLGLQKAPNCESVYLPGFSSKGDYFRHLPVVLLATYFKLPTHNKNFQFCVGSCDG